MTDPSDEARAFAALLAAPGPDSFIVLDEEGRIALVGREVERLAERRAEDLHRMGLVSAFGSAELDEVARSGQSGEARLGSSPERRYQVDVLPMASGGTVLWLHDTTALAHLSQVRRDFVANISHELRTPLAAIKLLAETISATAAGTDGPVAAFAHQIEREVDQLAQLVDELLDLSTIESGAAPLTLAPVDPAALVESVADRIRPMAERRGIVVTLVRGEGGPPVAADAGRLAQALLNLAHNAVKFSHSGGEVRIGWTPIVSGTRWWVADDGVGVPVQHRGRIFERFYKVDRARGRTDQADDVALSGSAGLGLAIVRHIAEAHGGTAGMESGQSVGSTFWIDIPY